MANNTELNLDEIKSVNLLSKNKVIKRICIKNDVAWESPEDEVTETCTVIFKRISSLNGRALEIPANTYKFATCSYHGTSLSPKIHVTDPIIIERLSRDDYSITFENVAVGYAGGIFESVNDEKYIMNNAAGLFYKDYLLEDRPYYNPNFTSSYCPNYNTTDGVFDSNYITSLIDGDVTGKDIIFYGTMINTGYIGGSGDRYSYSPPLYGYGNVPGYSDDENRKACYGIFTRNSGADPYIPFKLEKNHTYEFIVHIGSQNWFDPLSTSFVPEMYVPSNT